jgi:epimerase EvaD
MTYGLAAAYVPENELAVSALDPALRLPIPAGIDPIVSDRDRAAPTLAEAGAAGVLPDYAMCQTIENAGGYSADLVAAEHLTPRRNP